MGGNSRDKKELKIAVVVQDGIVVGVFTNINAVYAVVDGDVDTEEAEPVELLDEVATHDISGIVPMVCVAPLQLDRAYRNPKLINALWKFI